MSQSSARTAKHVVAFRATDDLYAWLEKKQGQMTEQTGLKLSISGVARSMLAKAKAEDEKNGGRRR